MTGGVLSAAYLPFSLALGLLLGLLALELAALLFGGSLIGGGDGADLPEPPADFDLPPGAEPDVAALIEASEAMPAAPSGALGLLGLGRVPFAVWLASALAGFGIGGVAVQGLASALFGGPLPVWLAVVPAAAAGLGAARVLAGIVGNLVKPVETTATGAQFLGGMRGIVTQGIARRGSPAEVRLRDRHGNMHYLRCEPFRDTDVIPEGTEVLTLRERRPGGQWGLRILPLTAD